MKQNLSKNKKIYQLEFEQKWDILNFQFNFWQYKANQVVGFSDYDSKKEFERCISHLEKILKDKRKIAKLY